MLCKALSTLATIVAEFGDYSRQCEPGLKPWVARIQSSSIVVATGYSWPEIILTHSQRYARRGDNR